MDLTRVKRRYLPAAFALLFLAGLFASARITFGSFGPDSDVSQAAMLWHGMRHHGPGFLKEWLFGPDNWLFSLYPITFALFALFGPKPEVAILTGWLVFVASVLVSGAIASALRAPRSALIVVLTLLWSGLYAHQAGFVSYPASHNVTNLFGLVAFLCALQWIKSGKGYLPLLAALSLVAGGLSDPWIVAAYALPLTLTSVLLFVLSRNAEERRASVPLCAAMILALAVIESRAFGALGFLAPFQFSIGSRERIAANAAYFVRDLGGLLNVVPGTASNELAPALASGLVFAALIVGVTRLIRFRDLRDAPVQVAFCCTIALSLFGMAVAVVISQTPVLDNSARFLVNELYLAPLGIAVLLELNWDRASRMLRLASMLAAALFVAAGIVGSAPLWRSPAIPAMDRGTRDLLAFLEDNHLNYGYGPYWGSQANAATWLSDFRIRIRPVVFDRSTGAMSGGTRGQSSRLWYLPGDAPPDQSHYFVFIRNDGEECPDPGVCVSGVVRQFGPPERTLHFKDATVLVWPRPLLRSSVYANYNLGERIDASELRDARGWSTPEAGSIWSDGESATVLLKLSSAPERDLELLIEGHAFVDSRHPVQDVEVLLNGRALAVLTYDSSSDATRSVRIARSLAAENEGRLRFEFRFRNARSPAELGLSGDVRRLGLAVVSLRLRAATP